MKKHIKNNITLIFLVVIPILSLFIGFLLNEDLSTGGAKWDFDLTWPIVINYSNLNFSTDITRHMPLHYVLLSLINVTFNDQNLVKIFYLFFSFLLPIFLYLNLSKIYNCKKFILIVFSSSFLFIPLFRASAIWPNAHLTATIFFLIGNFFYLKSKENNIFIYKIINLLFLSLAIYCIQTYLLLFLFYLYNYFSSEKTKDFIKLFLFSALLSLPGLFFIILNPRIVDLGNVLTRDIFYTISTNFSLIFFFLLFVLFNKDNLTIVISTIKNLTKIEICSIFLLFFFVFFNQELFTLDPRLRGGGFFYKLSYLIFKNNLIFIFSFFLGLTTSYVLIKYEPKFIYIFITLNLMSLNFIVYQKYFEPLFLIIISILFKNFLIYNVLLSLKNTLFFYSLIFLYFITAHINILNKISNNLVS
tara:strand:- start:759 stop:2006 length:1248 start_codon:yes stop_codon:yes gene_type:complete